MSNHRVDINKTLSEITSKKGCQEPGIPWVIPKNRLSEITQKVAQMIGTTLLVYEFPTFNPVTKGLWAYEKQMLSKTTVTSVNPWIKLYDWIPFYDSSEGQMDICSTKCAIHTVIATSPKLNTVIPRDWANAWSGEYCRSCNQDNRPQFYFHDPPSCSINMAPLLWYPFHL